MSVKPLHSTRSSSTATSGRVSAGVEVYKFGGASLSDAGAFLHAADIVVAARGRVVVVCSAPAGVTDLLLAVAGAAVEGDSSRVARATTRLRDIYRGIVHGVRMPRGVRTAVDREVAASLEELAAIGDGLLALRELTPRIQDLIVARGERLSARIFQAVLQARRVQSAYVDALELIATRGPFGGAAPDLAATDRLVRRRLGPLLARQFVPVVPGFLGGFIPEHDESAHGRAAPHTVTLGRGGSDLTATLLGRALSATRVSLWKDVPGLMTADPRVVPDARVVPQLNLREAAELAYYGAKVLHPRALIPVAGKSIPVHVRPFADPVSLGTEISSRHTLVRYPVKALSAATGQALITIAGRGLLGVPGVAGRAFSALSHHGLSVSLISQSSSEQTICFTVPEGQARSAQRCLQEAFAQEIRRREVDSVQILPGMATIAVVGLGMAGHVGIAARVFGALAAGAVNLVAIAQGSSELNISFVVSAAQAGEAQRRIHDAFQLAKIGGGSTSGEDVADVVLLGFGQIGRTLAELIVKNGRRPGTKGGARLRLVAILDSRGFVFDPAGLSRARIRQLVRAKQAGQTLADDRTGARRARPIDALRFLASHALVRPILVDVTAHDTVPLLLQGAEAGMDIVLANKRPLSGPRAEHDQLRAAVSARGGRLRFEATVGAGLPVLDTYRKLVESGDRVRKIEGCLSGTLGFVFTELGRGTPFSEAVREAMRRGYTEPDPRDDLSGADVGRKALILGRLLGFSGEPGDVIVESLVPEGARKLSRAEFLARLSSFDEEWRHRTEAARAREQTLRYVATVTPRKIVVGLRRLPRRSPFAALEGTDNQIAFTTARYRSPLVVTGAGAGLAVTAGGVLNDILDLLN